MKNICYLFILFCVAGCSNKLELLNEIYHLKLSNSQQKSLIIVYPTQGCSTCLFEMAQYSKINKVRYDIHSIISSPSNKELNYWKEQLNFTAENIYYDNKNFAVKNDLVSFKPMIYIVENNKIIKSVEYGCPKEKIFKSIHEYMNK